MERLLEKAEAQRSAEPAPAEVYPETLGQQEKADSMICRRRMASGLSWKVAQWC